MIRRLLTLVLPLLALAGCQDRDLPTAGPGLAPPGPDLLRISSPNTFTQLSAGGSHTCAVRSDGAVECWGDNYSGQAPATKSAASGTFTQVSAGAHHTCAVRSDGVAECWGYDGEGRAPASRSAASGSFTQVSGGSSHTCALRSDGVAECWGNSISGQAPASRSAASGSFTQVSAGGSHTCAVRSDGAVECWGSNYSGQAPATKSAASGTFTQVSAGLLHTCALRNDGVAECWGWGDTNTGFRENYGQAPASKSAASGTFTQVSAGWYHTCARRSDGAVECWGYDAYGQAPESKSAMSGSFTQVSGGSYYTCAVRSDGEAECWGSGQAPESRTATPNTTTILPTATFIATPTTVTSGESFTLALNNAQVPGYPDATGFTYAFDCGAGAPYPVFDAASNASCVALAAGTRTVKGTVKDQDGDVQEYTAAVTVLRLVVPIDLKPGSSTNPVSLAGSGDNVIPVAVLSSATFNAPALVAVATATLGDGAGKDAGVALRPKGTYHTEAKDVNGDKRADLVLYFRRADLIAAGALTSATTQLVLHVGLTDGRQVRGEDAVRVQ